MFGSFIKFIGVTRILHWLLQNMCGGKNQRINILILVGKWYTLLHTL